MDLCPKALYFGKMCPKEQPRRGTYDNTITIILLCIYINVTFTFSVLTIEGPGLDRRPGTSCTAACIPRSDDASGDEGFRPTPG